MTAIKKTVLKITCLHPAYIDAGSMSLDDLAHLMGDGEGIGKAELVSVMTIAPEDVEEEEQAVGGDGGFFAGEPKLALEALADAISDDAPPSMRLAIGIDVSNGLPARHSYDVLASRLLRHLNLDPAAQVMVAWFARKIVKKIAGPAQDVFFASRDLDSWPGGTDYAPVFEAASAWKADAIVMFTDGFGAYPKEAHARTHWARIGDFPVTSGAPFGTVHQL